jgi:hypothetical protein
MSADCPRTGSVGQDRGGARKFRARWTGTSVAKSNVDINAEPTALLARSNRQER